MKEHRAEVKAWKKDLGDAKSKIVRLEKEATVKKENKHDLKAKLKKKYAKVIDKIEDPSSTMCSICALKISNFIPEYFCGEKYNPTCESCKANDTSWNPDDR